MVKAKPASNTSELDAFIKERLHVTAALPEAFRADLAYFAKAASEGRVISFRAMAEWAQKKYGFSIGRTRLFNEMVKMGITPWWSK